MDRRLSNKRNLQNACKYVIVILLCVYCISPIFRIAVYNRPCADDYSYGRYTHGALLNGEGFLGMVKGAWKMVVHAYTKFSGLYTSSFINSFHPGIFGENWYFLSTWIIFFVILFFTFWSVYILNKHFVKRSLLFVVTASLVVVTMLVLWLPSAEQGLYWYNGSMNYMPFAFLNILNQCLLLEADDCMDRKKGKVLLCVSTGMSFLISGGNHVTAFANILFLLCAAGYRAAKKRFHVLFPLVAACAGFMVMYFAPGTQWRQGYFANDVGSRGIVETVIATLKHWLVAAYDWVSVSWLISLAIITPMAMEIAWKNKDKFSRRFPIIPFLLSGMVVSGMFCVPYLPMGYFGEGRVTNVIWITFMTLSWLLYVLVWGWLAVNEYVDLKRIFDRKHSSLVGFLTVCICLFALFFCYDGSLSVSRQANKELSNGTAAMYAQKLDERIARYRDESLTEVAVYPLPNPSKILPGKELDEDPNVWPNNVMGEWYGGKQIYLINETE